jgi:myo-inositol-1(or 4)-monophosphatase
VTDPSTLADDLALLVDAAREAGALALKRRTADLEIVKKADGTPVTSADLEVDALLTTRLRGARPSYGWLSEETADNPERLTTARQFLVDPIDGTRAYIRGHPWFVVALAVVEAGQPIAAAIYAPALEQMYAATVGGGATLDGQPIFASTATELENCAMLGDAPMFAHPAWRTPWPPMRIDARNAIALRMAFVAAGAYDAAVALSSKHEWDLAAGALIAAEAGAVVCDHQGEPLSFNGPTAACPSLVCCAPALAPLILARTRPIDLRR